MADLFSPPDRAEFVAWCEREFAAVTDMQALFALIDRALPNRQALMREKNAAAVAKVNEIVKAAHARLGGTA